MMPATLSDWLAFQLQLVDYLADSWRLWAVMGAALALLPTGRWIARFLHRQDDFDQFKPLARLFLAIALATGLLAIVAAGAIIPLATDGRLADLTRESAIYRGSIASAWLLWGVMGWSAAIAFAAHRWRIAGASVVWWMACYVASGLSMGAML